MRIVSDQAIANALKGSKVTPTEKLLRGETKRKTPKAPAGTVFGTKVTPDTRHNLNTLKGAMAHFDRVNPYTNSTPDKLTNPDNIKRQKAKSYLYARANGQEGDFGRYLDEFETLWRMNTGKIDEVIARYKERRGNAAAGDKAPSVIARASVLSAEERYEKEKLIKKFGTDKPGLSDILSAVGQDISPTNAIRNLATTAAQGVYDLPEDWAPDAENDKLLKAGLMAGNVAEFLIPGLNAAKVASETGSVVAKSAEQKSLAPIGGYVKENLRALNPFESGIDPVERGFRALSLGLTALAVKPHVGGLKVKNFREKGRAVVGIAYEMISPAPTPNVLLPRAEALKAVLSAPAGKETIKVAKEIEKRYMDDDGYAEIRQAYSDKFRAANDESGANIPEADIDAAVTLLTASDLAIRDQAKGARPDISGELDVRGVNRTKVQEPVREPAPKAETGKPTKFKPQETKGYDQGEALDPVGLAKKNEPKTPRYREMSDEEVMAAVKEVPVIERFNHPAFREYQRRDLRNLERRKATEKAKAESLQKKEANKGKTLQEIGQSARANKSLDNSNSLIRWRNDDGSEEIGTLRKHADALLKNGAVPKSVQVTDSTAVNKAKRTLEALQRRRWDQMDPRAEAEAKAIIDNPPKKTVYRAMDKSREGAFTQITKAQFDYMNSRLEKPSTTKPALAKETVTLYHGSTTPGFSKFDPTKTVRGKMGPTQGQGTYLTVSPEEASRFSKPVVGPYGGGVYKVEVTGKFLRLSDKIDAETYQALVGKKGNADTWDDAVYDAERYLVNNGMEPNAAGKAVADKLRKMGYDGLIENTEGTDNYIVWDPGLIKNKLTGKQMGDALVAAQVPDAGKMVQPAPKPDAPAKEELWEMTREEVGIDRAVPIKDPEVKGLVWSHPGAEVTPKKKIKSYSIEDTGTNYKLWDSTGVASVLKGTYGKGVPNAFKRAIEHARKLDVESALKEGKPVPKEVLAEYPDLAKKYEAPAKESPAAPKPVAKQERLKESEPVFEYDEIVKRSRERALALPHADKIGFGAGKIRPSTPDEMRLHAINLRKRAESVVSSARNRLNSIPSIKETGASNYQKNFGRKNSKAIASMENAFAKAKEYREAASKWDSRASFNDPDIMRLRIREKQAEAEARARVKQKESVARKSAPIVNRVGGAPMTSAEWAKEHKDYKGIYVVDGVRVRRAIIDGALREVYLTDKPATKPDAPAKKEPWEMTRVEFEVRGPKAVPRPQRHHPRNERITFPDGTYNDFPGGTGGFDAARASNGYHREQVQKALKEGKPVPKEVLADYPGLAKKYEAPAKESPAAPKPVAKPESGKGPVVPARKRLDSEEGTRILAVTSIDNIRGRSSSGNWAVRAQVERKGVNGLYKAEATEYFFRKDEAVKWAESVKAKLKKAPEQAVAPVKAKSGEKKLPSGWTEPEAANIRKQLAPVADSIDKTLDVLDAQVAFAKQHPGSGFVKFTFEPPSTSKSIKLEKEYKARFGEENVTNERKRGDDIVTVKLPAGLVKVDGLKPNQKLEFFTIDALRKYLSRLDKDPAPVVRAVVPDLTWDYNALNKLKSVGEKIEQKSPGGVPVITGPSGKTMTLDEFKEFKKGLKKGELPLFQQLAPKKNIQGQYVWDAKQKRGVVTLFENADISTILHETSHHYLRYTPEPMYKAIAAGAGVDPNTDLDKLKRSEYVKVQEFWARGVEETLYRNAVNPNPKVQAAFNHAAKRIRQIYGEAGVPLPERRGGRSLNQSNPQTKTPAFKKWFGNSKVVDEKGEPLVVYHGTDDPGFEEFGKQTTADGYFFAPDPETANFYVSGKYGQGGVYPVYLKIEKLADFDDPEIFDKVAREAIWNTSRDEKAVRTFAERLYKDGYHKNPTVKQFFDSLDGIEDIGNDGWTIRDVLKENSIDHVEIDKLVEELDMDRLTDEYNRVAPVEEIQYAQEAYGGQEFYRSYQDDFMQAARSLGYDGVVFSDPSSVGESTSYVVFEPTQIKSAIANKGTFDPNDPSILNQRSGKGGEKPDYSAVSEVFAQMLGGTVKPIREGQVPVKVAPKAGQDFGISNAAFEESSNIVAPVGKGQSAKSLVEAAKQSIQDDQSALALARSIRDGETPKTAKALAELQAGVGLLEGRVNRAFERLSKNPGDPGIKADYETARAQLQEYADSIQRAKSEWSDEGRVLAARVDEMGNFARMQASAAAAKGAPLTPNEVKELKAMSEKFERAKKELQLATDELQRLRAESAVATAATRKRLAGSTKRIREDAKTARELLSSRALNQLSKDSSTEDLVWAIAKEHILDGDKDLQSIAKKIGAEFEMSPNEVIQYIGAPSKPRTKSEVAIAIANLRKEARQLTGNVRKPKPVDLVNDKAAIAKRLDEINKKIQEYQTKLKAGDYSVPIKAEKAKAQSIIEAEGALWMERRKFESMRRHLANPEPKAKKVIKEAAGVLRWSQLGADVGALLRQGRYVVQHPRAYGKGLKNMILAMKNDESYASVMASIEGRNMTDGKPAMPIRVKAGLSLTDQFTHLEEAFTSQQLKKIPLVGKYAGFLERAQVGFLNTVRAEMFDAFYNSAGDLSLKELQSRARLINSLTGRSNVKNVPEALSVIMTSPRYYASRWELLTAGPENLYKALLNGDRGAQANMKDIAASLASLAVPLITAHIILNRKDEKDGVTLDPASSDFLKVRIDGTVYDISAGMAPKLRALLRAVMFVTTKRDEEKRADTGWLMDTIEKEWTGAISPGVRTPLELYAGRSLTGFEIDDPKDRGIRKLMPLIVQQTWKNIESDAGAGIIAAHLLGELVGATQISNYKYKAPSEARRPGTHQTIMVPAAKKKAGASPSKATKPKTRSERVREYLNSRK